MNRKIANYLSLTKPVVLVGLMGCGKSSLGRRLAKACAVPFVDTDRVIENEQNQPVSEIFKTKGEKFFRECEWNVINKELDSPEYHIIATGGGAFMQDSIQSLIREKGVSLWLDTPYEILLERVSRKNTRPLLEKGNKAEIMRELMDARNPIYARADIHIQGSDVVHEVTVEQMIDALVEKGILVHD